MEKSEKELYETYLFNCWAEGDIWHIYYRSYTFEEWMSRNKPQYGGLLLDINKPPFT